MQIQVIGKVSGLIRSMSLEYEWSKRKQNPFMPKGKEKEDNSQIAMIRRQAEQARKQSSISAIEGKMKAGMKLSSDDMDYLRENAPELYEKAVAIKKEREEYRRKLEQCRTKEDVERLNMQKTQQLFSEAKAIANNGNIPRGKKLERLEYIAMRMMSVKNEHIIFLETPEYAELPSELDEDERKESAPIEEVPDEDEALPLDIEFLKRRRELAAQASDKEDVSAHSDLPGPDGPEPHAQAETAETADGDSAPTPGAVKSHFHLTGRTYGSGTNAAIPYKPASAKPERVFIEA